MAEKKKYFFDLFSFQSKLNCEVLWDDLAFEVRWAVAGDSIVLQLVSKLGKNFTLNNCYITPKIQNISLLPFICKTSKFLNFLSVFFFLFSLVAPTRYKLLPNFGPPLLRTALFVKFEFCHGATLFEVFLLLFAAFIDLKVPLIAPGAFDFLCPT